jgi:tetratricopeptide (TPR) repeat protein
MRMKYFAIVLALTAGLTMGQKVKSQKELDAVKAMLAAQAPDAKIAAVEDLLTKYKDTEFKSIALTQAAQACQAKGDQITGLQYANRALEADPKNYQAMLLVAQFSVQGTREFDLDKDEKLARAAKAANDTIATLNTAPKPNPQLTDDQWNDIKKDFVSQAHEALGMAAAVQKKTDVAVSEFKLAIDGASTPDPGTMIRLAAVYNDAGKYDDAAPLLDKVLASSAPDGIKRVAQNEKQRADKLKAAKK